MDGNNMNNQGYENNQPYTGDAYNQYNTYQPAPQGGSKGLGITSMVLGILALLITLLSCCFAPLLIVSGILGLVSFILGFIAIAKKKGRGMGIAGVICSAVGILAAIPTILMSVFNVALFGIGLTETMQEMENYEYYYDYDYDDYDYDYDYDF